MLQFQHKSTRKHHHHDQDHYPNTTTTAETANFTTANRDKSSDNNATTVTSVGREVEGRGSQAPGLSHPAHPADHTSTSHAAT